MLQRANWSLLQKLKPLSFFRAVKAKASTNVSARARYAAPKTPRKIACWVSVKVAPLDISSTVLIRGKNIGLILLIPTGGPLTPC